MKTYNAERGQPILLGRRWEHLARRIVFDISDWVDDFGAGTVQLLHQRQGDEAPYPVTITRTDADGVTVNDATGTLVLWNVTNTDTHDSCHYGRAELRYYRGTQVAPEFMVKSELYHTVVENAMGAAMAVAPEEEPDWLATLLTATGSVDSQIEAARGYAEDAETYAGNAQTHAGDASDAQSAAETSASNAAASALEAENHKNEIANMHVSARSLPTGQEASVQIQESITLPRQLVMRFGIPRGEKGDTGATFTPSVSASGDLSWSNDGGLANPETRNVKGPVGVSVTDVTQTVTSLESGGGNTVTVTLSDGNAYTFNVMNGAKGDKGDPFQIAKTYASIAAMNADTSVSSGSFVVIASNTEDPDNAKLFVKGDNGFTFLTDLSGAQGIQGPPGADGVSILSVTHTTDANGNILLTVTLSNGNTATFTVPKGDTGTFSPEDLQRITAIESENALLRELLRGVDTPIYRTASGNPATFDDGYAANVKALSVTITPTQSGSGDPSPDNIRPISGVDSVTVTRTGENGANSASVTVSLVDSNGDPLTVYGGTLDVTTGLLNTSLDRVVLTGAEDISYNVIPQFSYFTITLDASKRANPWQSATACSHYNAHGSSAYQNSMQFDGQGNCRIMNATHTSVESFRQYLSEQVSSGTPVTILYERARTYQLAPAQLATLSGYNAVTTDAGTLTVEYQSNLNDANPLTFTDIAAASPVGEQHRMVFGGRNLGSSVNAAQIAAVRDGSFSGLLVGDYWTINGVTWRIVDMDYWYGCGDAAFNRHHLVIMPDSNLTTAPMNETSTTAGGYVGSKMYTDTLPTIKTTCAAAFPSMILTHRDFLVSAVTNGKPSAGIWRDSDVELPSEIMMYGCRILSPANDGATVATLNTISRQQLALFNLVPRFIKSSAWFWLRDPVSATDFAGVYGHGAAGYYGASSGGVRPVFAVG